MTALAPRLRTPLTYRWRSEIPLPPAVDGPEMLAYKQRSKDSGQVIWGYVRFARSGKSH